MNPWRIDIVDVATIPRLPLSGFLPAAALAGSPPDAVIDVPCFAFLLTGAGGTVLVDTGPDPAAAARSGFTACGQPRQALVAALAARDRGPGDVDLIVHTHLHYDHMQNDDLFPDADVVIQEREARWAAGPDADEFCLCVADFLAGLGGRLRLLDDGRELRPGLRVLPTGGHTPGHHAVLVQTGTGITCIAGDLVPLRANTRHIQPSCRDPAAVQAFLARARAESWRLMPSHDPDMRAAPGLFLDGIVPEPHGDGGDR